MFGVTEGMRRSGVGGLGDGRKRAGQARGRVKGEGSDSKNHPIYNEFMSLKLASVDRIHREVQAIRL